MEGMVLLYSGGFDSNAVLLDYLDRGGDKVHLLYFEFDKSSAEKAVDNECISKMMDHVRENYKNRSVILEVVEYPLNHGKITEDGNFYFPNRNSIMINIAVAKAQELNYNRVGIGIIDNGPDSFSDSTLEYGTLMNVTVQEATEGKVFLHLPFGKYTKKEIFDSMFPVQQDVLLNSSSYCYLPSNFKNSNGDLIYDTCGECGGCIDFKSLVV